MELIRTAPYHLSSPPRAFIDPINTAFQPLSSPPPLYAASNNLPLDRPVISKSNDNSGELVDETGRASSRGRPSGFPVDQTIFLQKIIPTYLALPTRRKNSLRKAFFETTQTEFAVHFSEELSKAPVNMQELGARIKRFFYNSAKLDSGKAATKIRNGIFTASSDGTKGFDIPKPEAELYSALLGIRPKPTKTTAFTLFVSAAQDDIEAALRERMTEIGATSQTAGQRRHIESTLFNQLSQEERDEYEAEAKDINSENQQHFDQNVSDEVIFQNQTQLHDVMKRVSLAALGRGRSKMGDGIIHVQFALKGPSGPIIKSLLVSTVNANFIESNVYKSRGIAEAFATYATSKLYPDTQMHHGVETAAETALAGTHPPENTTLAGAQEQTAPACAQMDTMPARTCSQESAALASEHVDTTPARDCPLENTAIANAQVDTMLARNRPQDTTNTSAADNSVLLNAQDILMEVDDRTSDQTDLGAGAGTSDSDEWTTGEHPSDHTPGLSSRISSLEIDSAIPQPDFTNTRKRGRPGKQVDAVQVTKDTVTNTATKASNTSTKKLKTASRTALRRSARGQSETLRRSTRVSPPSTVAVVVPRVRKARK